MPRINCEVYSGHYDRISYFLIVLQVVFLKLQSANPCQHLLRFVKIRRHVLIDCLQPWIDGENLCEIVYIAGGKQGQPGGHSVILIHRILVFAEYVKGYQIETLEKFQFQSGIKDGLSKMQILTIKYRRLEFGKTLLKEDDSIDRPHVFISKGFPFFSLYPAVLPQDQIGSHKIVINRTTL